MGGLDAASLVGDEVAPDRLGQRLSDDVRNVLGDHIGSDRIPAETGRLVAGRIGRMNGLGQGVRVKRRLEEELGGWSSDVPVGERHRLGSGDRPQRVLELRHVDAVPRVEAILVMQALVRRGKPVLSGQHEVPSRSSESRFMIPSNPSQALRFRPGRAQLRPFGRERPVRPWGRRLGCRLAQGEAVRIQFANVSERSALQCRAGSGGIVASGGLVRKKTDVARSFRASYVERSTPRRPMWAMSSGSKKWRTSPGYVGLAMTSSLTGLPPLLTHVER